jgi:hypothetical protein
MMIRTFRWHLWTVIGLAVSSLVGTPVEAQPGLTLPLKR